MEILMGQEIASHVKRILLTWTVEVALLYIYERKGKLTLKDRQRRRRLLVIEIKAVIG